jgi:hypothetical protein
MSVLKVLTFPNLECVFWRSAQVGLIDLVLFDGVAFLEAIRVPGVRG